MSRATVIDAKLLGFIVAHQVRRYMAREKFMKSAVGADGDYPPPHTLVNIANVYDKTWMVTRGNGMINDALDTVHAEVLDIQAEVSGMAAKMGTVELLSDRQELMRKMLILTERAEALVISMEGATNG